MDGSRFDELTRALALSGSRRRVLKGILGALTGGLLGGRLHAGAGQSCTGLRKRCAADADCCSGLCDPGTGRCVCATGTQLCGGDCIPVDQFQDDIDNCGGCFVHCRKAPDCQVAACLAGVCGSVADPAQVGQSCGRDAQVCAGDGTCVCPADQPTLCRQGCVDTTTDTANCGACGNRCPFRVHGDATCSGGVCGFVCDSGYSVCGNKCCSDDRECCNGDCCGPNQCCSANGCVLCQCVIGIDAFDNGEINPQNACQYCNPAQDQRGWTNSDDGTFCGDGRVCCNAECCSPSECCDGVQCTDVNCPDQCEIQGQPVEADVRNPDNDCQSCQPDKSRFDWTVLDDQTSCGQTPGRVCCNGACCSPTECCGATSCEECGPHCRIGGKDIPEGDANPSNPCQVCKPSVTISDWSPADGDVACGTGQVCCAGECCPLGLCCNAGTCGECRCHIGDEDIDRGTVDPFNACRICNPDANRDDWSPGPNNIDCGLFNDRFCCGGDCCPAGTCCNALGDCEPCGCVIDTEPVLENAVNPANTCQVCKPSRDRRDWTVLDDDESCGTDTDDRVCCGGVCCPQGQCCTNGSCQDCGCEINGNPVARNTINADNVCQICDPTRDRFDWSPRLGDITCGANGDQHCCGGDCCPTGQCCLLDACGECLCHIGDDNIAAGTPNAANACQVCNPDRDPFDWTVLGDNDPCAGLAGQFCCGGACCGPDQCCVNGACGACCIIDNSAVPQGTVNSENPCQICDSLLDATGWSPNEGTFCGAAGDQVCCAGDCCPAGHCCSLDNQCEPCKCTIGGETVVAGTPNPENPCQVCDPDRDPIDWSSTDDDSSCGEDRVCCDGSCCAQGECCTGGQCLFCDCVIEDEQILEGTINPDNPCQICDPLLDTTAWSPNEGAFCGAAGDQVCCAGLCCSEGECCSLDGTCESCGGCLIDGQRFADGEVNPDNDCEVCNPAVSTTDWSAPAESTRCEFGEGRCCGRECCFAQCCGDVCCAGEAVCGECGGDICTIDGTTVPKDSVNPANSCETCDPFFTTTAWTVQPDNGSCGPDGTQFCCNGVCCESRACCNENDVCEVAGSFVCENGCDIDGKFYPIGFRNPDNPCEICAPFDSTTDWTPNDNHVPCSADSTQHCCNGVCCDAGFCCTAPSVGGVCEVCACEIDFQSWVEGAINPVNACQMCDSSISTTAWSPSAARACGFAFSRDCCSGVCCDDTQCCGFSGACEPRADDLSNCVFWQTP